MGSLKQLRFAMKSDKNIRRMMVRGNSNEILLDIDGDSQPDIAIQDINHDGNIDRLAFDTTGEGYYDFFIDDTDNNGIPDHIFTFVDGGENEMDKVEEIAAGPELEAAIVESVHRFMTILELEEIMKEELDAKLAELERNVKSVRMQLR